MIRYTVDRTAHGYRVMDGQNLVYEFTGLNAGTSAAQYAAWSNDQSDYFREHPVS